MSPVTGRSRNISDGSVRQLDEVSLTRRRVVVVLSAFLILLEGINLSLPAPFFPKEGRLKGLNEWQIGLVTGAFDGSNLIFSFAIAYILKPQNLKFFYCTGMIWSSVTQASFGLLSYGPGGNTYFLMCLTTRLVNGIGGSMVYSTVLPMAASMFPDNSSVITSIIQTCIGVGLVIGPPVGSVLYSFGGYIMPFIAVAIVEAVAVSIAIWIVPVTDGTKLKEKIKQSDYFRFITRPGFLCLGFPLLVLFGIAGFRDSCYSLYFIDNLGMSPSGVGYVFLSLSIAFVVSGPIYGYLVEKGLGAYVGLCVVTSGPLTLLLFYLAKLIPVLRNVGYASSILVLNGMTLSGIMNPAYLLLEKLAYRNGFRNQNHIKTMVATAYNLIAASGRLFGSFILGGIIIDNVGFYDTCLVYAILLTCTAVIYDCYLCGAGFFKRLYYMKDEEGDFPALVEGASSGESGRFGSSFVSSMNKLEVSSASRM